ncbi:hypothetical protein GALL_481950 [mine drainage metagenome]|uniref:Uncharacterized protein n=1 Tax=mine drainage metagenome TaxID=410659 RepID=A0A1J5Q2U2_9ZZZZ
MDALAPYTNELLQDGQVGVAQEMVVCGPSLLTINKPLILIDQFACGIDNNPLIVPEAVDMRARLYQNRISQGRRQRCHIVEVSWIPTRQ